MAASDLPHQRRTSLGITNFAGYEGASRDSRNLRNWHTTSGDADSTINRDAAVLRSRAHDLSRNAPIVAGAIRTNTVNVVGTGLTLQSRIDREVLPWLAPDQADALERQIEREWAMWAGSPECDMARTSNFSQLQEIAMRGAMVAGDIFAFLPTFQTGNTPYHLRVQLVEADRVSNPQGKTNSATLVAGVEKDPNSGAPTGYHVQSSHPGSMTRVEQKWTLHPAFGAKTGRRTVIHLYRPQRAGQTRGVSELAPIIDLVKQLTRYTNAEVAAAVTSALFTVFVKTEMGDGLAQPTISPGSPAVSAGADDDFKMGHGNIVNLMPGESIETATPGRPNVAFPMFVEAVLEQVGSSLGIPFELLRMHFSASYSASRAALLEAQKGFRSVRQWLASSFCQPIYETWFTEAVALGRISAPGFIDGDFSVRAAYLGSEWVGPSFGNIDPLKEVKAAQLRISEGLSTISAESTQNGRDFDADHAQRAKEQRMRLESGLVQPVVIEETSEDERPDEDDK